MASATPRTIEWKRCLTVSFVCGPNVRIVPSSVAFSAMAL
jgi:hypothetical protein